MVDQLVLLLSTDWFKPYWNVLAIEADDATTNLIQLECREITKQILSGATNYYHISFAPDRIEKTRSMLRSVVSTSGAGKSLQQLLEYWDQLSDEDEKAAWMWSVLTIDLVTGRIGLEEPRLDSAIRDTIFAEYESYEMEGYEFMAICEKSQSAWDQYTRTLTPEQPTALSDTLASVLCARRFETFWHSMRNRLTSKQADDLISWYRNLAKARARRDLVPSYVR